MLFTWSPKNEFNPLEERQQKRRKSGPMFNKIRKTKLEEDKKVSQINKIMTRKRRKVLHKKKIIGESLALQFARSF